MGKRYTDTEKWKKAWFRKLPVKMKAVWSYLCEQCDHAGIWNVDLDAIEFHVGESVTIPELLGAFPGRLQLFDNGEKLWLKTFFDFQYETAKDGFQAKKSALVLLHHYGLIPGDSGETPPTVLPDSPDSQRHSGDSLGIGIGITLKSSSSEKSEKAPIPSEHLSECLEAWGKTLARHKIQKDPRLDLPEIIRLIHDRGYEQTRMALVGAGFEESRPGYNASKNVRISRFWKPSNFDMFVNLGAQNSGQVRTVFDPERKPA